MTKCSVCSQDIPTGALFCGKCGARAETTVAPPAFDLFGPGSSSTSNATVPPRATAASPPPGASTSTVLPPLQPLFVLACISGPDTGKRMVVGAHTVTLGSSSSSGLLSSDPDVAPEHMDFFVNSGVLAFRARPESPVFVDGVRLSEGTLGPRQQLRVGRSFWQLEVAETATAHAALPTGATLFQKLGEQVGAVAGVTPVEGLDAREMFSSVLQQRTEDDIEDYFMAGTRSTTPPIETVAAVWPKPWAFFKIFLMSILVYIGFLLGLQQFANEKLLPGMMIIGSFAIPLTVVVFYFEMNIPRNVSFYQIFKALLVGGIVSLIASLFGFNLLGSAFHLPLPGLVEEAGKVAALMLFVNMPRFRWTLNGLLLGGAVGAGFAGFESAGYALDALLISHSVGPMLTSVFFRGVLAPGGHVAWAALEGAALWKVKGDRPFTWAMLQDMQFLRVFGLCAALHTLWDLPLLGIPLTPLMYYILIAGLIVVAWIAILSFIQDGIKQIQRSQQEQTIRG